MSDTLRDVLADHAADMNAENGYGDHCGEVCVPDLAARNVVLSDAQAAPALDVERLRKAFDEYIWGLSMSPGGQPCEKSVRYFADKLLASLAASQPDEAPTYRERGVWHDGHVMGGYVHPKCASCQREAGPVRASQPVTEDLPYNTEHSHYDD